MLSRKGGSGKSTLAVHLAVLAQQSGRRTLLIDLDPQRSAADWWRAREAESPHLAETDPGSPRDVLDAARTDGVEVVVIDTRPSAEQDAALVAALSDLILVPTRPAILDLRAILGTIDVVKGAIRRSMIVTKRLPAAARRRRGVTYGRCEAGSRGVRRTCRVGRDRQSDNVRECAADRPDGRRDRAGRQGRERDARALACGGEGIEP